MALLTLNGKQRTINDVANIARYGQLIVIEPKAFDAVKRFQGKHSSSPAALYDFLKC